MEGHQRCIMYLILKSERTHLQGNLQSYVDGTPIVFNWSWQDGLFALKNPVQRFAQAFAIQDLCARGSDFLISGDAVQKPRGLHYIS